MLAGKASLNTQRAGSGKRISNPPGKMDQYVTNSHGSFIDAFEERPPPPASR
jgi:hypothetical protein